MRSTQVSSCLARQSDTKFDHTDVAIQPDDFHARGVLRRTGRPRRGPAAEAVGRQRRDAGSPHSSRDEAFQGTRRSTSSATPNSATAQRDVFPPTTEGHRRTPEKLRYWR